jgi:hypothetical protein
VIGTVLLVLSVAALTGAVIAGLYIALGRLYRASQLLNTQCELLRSERALLMKQKELTLLEISMHSLKMERAAIEVQNSLVAAKLTAERMTDPDWAKDFERGRDNAPWN